MRNSYTFEGIDAESVEESARWYASKGEVVFVHYHKVGEPCSSKCHKIEPPKENDG